jgi:hypothetical protein
MNYVNQTKMQESSTATINSPLSSNESARLAELEPIIQRGLKHFTEVGAALQEIRENRLYRQTHLTFEDYVEKRWGLKVRRAYQLCEAAGVVRQIGDVQNFAQSPLNESQARALAKVKPEERVAVLMAVSAKGKVTAQAISRAAQDRKSTLIIEVENARAKARPMTNRQAWIFAYGSHKEQISADALNAGLSEISFGDNNGGYKTWNTQEHLEFLLTRLRRVSARSGLKARPDATTYKTGLNEILRQKLYKADRAFLQYWDQAAEGERGELIFALMSKRLVVPDKAALISQVERWLKKYVVGEA